MRDSALCEPASSDTFNAEEFVRELDSGVFDGRITEVVARLTSDQLEEVHRVLWLQHSYALSWR